MRGASGDTVPAVPHPNGSVFSFLNILVIISVRIRTGINVNFRALWGGGNNIKKDDKLIIDQMLVLNKYETLSEDETRKTLCDDIFLYFKEIILKYKDRFQDFDAVMFIPLLEERFEEIKEQKFISNRNPTKIY